MNISCIFFFFCQKTVYMYVYILIDMIDSYDKKKKKPGKDSFHKRCHDTLKRKE